MQQSKPALRSRAKALQTTGLFVFFAVGLGALVAAKVYGPVFYALAAASVIGLGVLGSSRTTRLDEVAQHAHVVAWFWGGLAGLAFAAAGLFVLAATASNPSAPESRAFLFGFGFAVVPMLLGYLAYWLHFWLRRR